MLWYRWMQQIQERWKSSTLSQQQQQHNKTCYNVHYIILTDVSTESVTLNRTPLSLDDGEFVLSWIANCIKQ